ncbi:Hypothetical protein MVR_LOCUS212 [uncultured virus]|nr:Hypothetical protein MVR_LOCUS212 [uncultured virus]
MPGEHRLVVETGPIRLWSHPITPASKYNQYTFNMHLNYKDPLHMKIIQFIKAIDQHVPNTPPATNLQSSNYCKLLKPGTENYKTIRPKIWTDSKGVFRTKASRRGLDLGAASIEDLAQIVSVDRPLNCTLMLEGVWVPSTSYGQPMFGVRMVLLNVEVDAWQIKPSMSRPLYKLKDIRQAHKKFVKQYRPNTSEPILAIEV